VIRLNYFKSDEEAPTDRASLELSKCLDNSGRLQTLLYRCRDLNKLLEGPSRVRMFGRLLGNNLPLREISRCIW
jgi:hypothetical protein